jgi:tetratricopeptide (TPR) repeat protein
VLAVFLLYFTLYPGSPQNPQDVIQQAFDLAYNLEHDAAIALVRKAIAASPEDPSLHRAVASLIWLNILFQRGAVTVDHYMGSFTRTQVTLARPPPDLDRDFRAHVARAITLAERRVAANPRDAQAHYDLGAAVGLQASYTATVDGKLMAGFRAARRAFDEHEEVLELAPSRKDAGLIIGTYRYVVATLSLPLRWMAYVAGFGGGKDRGIEMLREAAAYPGDSRVDALFALVLVYNRERRYDEALRVLQELRQRYPRNRLVVLEQGATALRAGRYQEADRILSEGLGTLARETRPRIPGEEGLWRLKRGAARARLNQLSGAQEDLAFATGTSSQNWVRGRAHAELAELALSRGDQQAARNEASRAEALCTEGNDPGCVNNARRLSRRAHGR